MASVYFKCSCGQNLAVEAADELCQVKCPSCGRRLQVPAAEVSFRCACGEELLAPQSLVGGTVLCASCKAEHTVPSRLRLSTLGGSACGKPDQLSPGGSFADVPRVPVGRKTEVECPQCGYLLAPVLKRCPRCQHVLYKGRSALRKSLAVARAVLIIALGWFLAAYWERLHELIAGLFGRGIE